MAGMEVHRRSDTDRPSEHSMHIDRQTGDMRETGHSKRKVPNGSLNYL